MQFFTISTSGDMQMHQKICIFHREKAWHVIKSPEEWLRSKGVDDFEWPVCSTN